MKKLEKFEKNGLLEGISSFKNLAMIKRK